MVGRWHEEARQRGAFLTSGDWNDVRDSRREVEEDVVSSGGNKDRLKLDRDRQVSTMWPISGGILHPQPYKFNPGLEP